jgi:hypothetical protein
VRGNSILVPVDELLRRVVNDKPWVDLIDLDDVLFIELPAPRPFESALHGFLMSLKESLPAIRTRIWARYDAFRDIVEIVILHAPAQGCSQRDITAWRCARGVYEPVWKQIQSVLREQGVDLFDGDLSSDFPSAYLRFQRPAAMPKPARGSVLAEKNRLPLDAFYQLLVERGRWSEVRWTSYRFSFWAWTSARMARERAGQTVLCPAVGIRIDPWLFAHAGCRVVALDTASAAIEMLAHPERYPRVLSRKAYDSQMLMGNGSEWPRPISEMPALENAAVCRTLRERIAFLAASVEHLPVCSRSVGTIFAGFDGLPEGVDIYSMIEEWLRVLGPGGHIFVMLNDRSFSLVKAYLLQRGLSDDAASAAPAISDAGSFTLMAGG